MSDINIPGVSDRYKTNDLVKSLMEVERIPLKRAQETLETYKAEQAIWRRVNQQMTALRDSSTSLYSYNNPFNEKIAASADESVLTASAGRDAAFETFKIEVMNVATADRFLSKELDKNYTVPSGLYKFTAGDKTVSFNWKGGSVNDFAAAVNKRSNNTVKASVINIAKDTQTLLIESLKTGTDNRLVFEGDALPFALEAGLVEPSRDTGSTFGTSRSELRDISGMASQDISVADGVVTVPPENGTQIAVPDILKKDGNLVLEFTVRAADVEDVALARRSAAPGEPNLGSAGSVSFAGVTVDNMRSETGLPEAPPPPPSDPVNDPAVLYLKKADGTEVPLQKLSGTDAPQTFKLNMADYGPADSLVIRNNNTGKSIAVTDMRAYDPATVSGYQPVNPVSTAADAKFKYEGITISRPSNEIDDVVPGVTLNLQGVSEKPVTVKVEPDTETAKEAIIALVGNYNRLIAEINILTQTKPEIITEISYFTQDEQTEAEKRLGTFQGDFTLTNEKNTLQRIFSDPYRTTDDAELTMLSQIGISTKTGTSTTYAAGNYRGYLEIDEKKLDEALKNDIAGIKNLFGFDSNGDLIIDSGVAYRLDKNLQSYVQSGGIIATKTNGLDTKIKSTENQITRLDSQLAVKEQELKTKYGAMEGTLNSLESQSSTISNFNNRNNGRN